MENNKKIVVVDDDMDLLRILDYYLKSKGFTVYSISTGTEALEYLLNEKNLAEVSLLILDRMLPDMDGLDILTALTNKYPDKVPVLILSALKADKDVLEGLKKGAVDYIGKPFNHDVLIAKAISLIARKQHV